MTELIEIAKKCGFREDFIEGNDIILRLFAKEIRNRSIDECVDIARHYEVTGYATEAIRNLKSEVTK